MKEEQPFSPKQYDFLSNCTATWNLAHGSVRTGKTIVTLYAYMCYLDNEKCVNNWMIGYTSSTIYNNAIKLLFENPIFSIFRPFCSWNKQKNILTYKDKIVDTCGADTAASLGRVQGQTIDSLYCDEMTLYADSMLHMLQTRLSNSWSRGFGAMNPAGPNHPVKQWIDQGEAGDESYYSQHYTLEDNPYLDDSYKERIKHSLSGLFYKRNYLGLWVLAEGAIFDFFDEKLHTTRKPPRSAEYWVAGIDYGTVNAFACVLIGVSTGRYTQSDPIMWAEKEYYWDSKVKGRQKTNSEYADDVQKFLQDYGIKALYIDPSAAAFKIELRKRGVHTVDADNDVINGIQVLTDKMKSGSFVVCCECKNLIREIQGYVWDDKAAKQGYDAPLKKEDHIVDATRYVINTHKLPKYNPYKKDQEENDSFRDRLHPGGSKWI